jgi:hypothetical protein
MAKLEETKEQEEISEELEEETKDIHPSNKIEFDNEEFSGVMAEMKRLLLEGQTEKGHNTNVRKQTVIRLLHDYLVKKLQEKTGFKLKEDSKEKDMVFIDTEVKIPGFHKVKNVDIAVVHKRAGPLLLISVKSLMSSITNNFTNDYESAIGDAISLHERYPYLIYGYVIIFPKEVLIRDETFNLDYYEGFLRKINLRVDEQDKNKKYERLSMIVGDFKANPPKLSSENPSDKNLRIETFIHDICEVLRERYEMLKIIKY